METEASAPIYGLLKRPTKNIFLNIVNNPISGSASALWDITDQHQVSLDVTHSQRAPQIQELFSNGVHEATRSYELGNADLNKEPSNNLDLGYRYNADWMTAELNLF